MFNLLRNHKTVFQAHYTILNSYQQHMKASVFSYYHYICLFHYSCSYWLKSSISLWFWFTFSWQVLIVNIFSCACWPFVYIIWRLIQIVCPFLNWVTCMLLLSYQSSLYILNTNFKSDVWFENFSSHFVGCHSTFLIVSFKAQTEFEFWWYPFYPFFILLLVLLVWYLKNLPSPWSRFTPKFLLLIVV